MYILKKDFFSEYIKIIILQCVFIAVLIILSTVLRFADFSSYKRFGDLYNEYFMSDISLSLVFEGE